jgi:hypothetical protein
VALHSSAQASGVLACVLIVLGIFCISSGSGLVIMGGHLFDQSPAGAGITLSDADGSSDVFHWREQA